MSTLPLFSMGENSSAALMNQAFATLVAQGNSILNTMSEIQVTTLVDFQRALTALNSRQQKAATVTSPGVALQFLVSDFDNINQGISTATIRVDAATANLREKNQYSQVLVSSTLFNSSIGSVQSIDSEATLFSVYSMDSAPTGTFILTLANVTDVSFLTINLSAMASSPNVAVSISQNGLTWIPANEVSIVGSLLNAWLPNTPCKYIQLIITPTHPDNLGGYTYTFGVTDLSGASVSYSLVSDLFFNPLSFPVESEQVSLKANNDAGLVYYITLDNGVPSEIVTVVATVDQPISLPGAAMTSSTETTSSGVIGSTIPTNTIINTITVADSSGAYLPVVPQLNPEDANISLLTEPRVSVWENELIVIPHPEDGTSYKVSYLTGPTTIIATLRVHMSTNDNTVTPVFDGAYLQEV